MHELSVTESVLNIALKHANQAEASRVTDIHIVIGQLSSIVDDSVQFYWDLISQNSICQGAILHFQRIPAKMNCQECNLDFDLKDQLSPCPRCGSIRLRVAQGDEFYIDSIEIEKLPESNL